MSDFALIGGFIFIKDKNNAWGCENFLEKTSPFT
jgi:hypothetical protein